MSWCTTSDLDRFAAAAGGFLRSRAAENILLLSASQQFARAVPAARTAQPGAHSRVTGQQPGRPGQGVLFGWSEPPDGGDPRGAFVHDPAVPLLISGTAPESATALAATLAKMGRQVCGVDAPTEVADAFAAAWSQRSGTTVTAHRNCRVYRLTGTPHGGTPPRGLPMPGAPQEPGAWPPPETPGPVGRLRVATVQDQALLATWLTAFAAETAERIGSPSDLAAELIGYGGAVFWEAPHKPNRLRDAAHYLAIPHHRDTAQFGEPAHHPVTLATLTRPVAGIVRISMLYTLPERRHSGYAAALTLAVSRAVLEGTGDTARGLLGAASGGVSEVVMITDMNRSDRWGSRFGYQLVGERAVLRFGPATGPMPRAQQTGGMPRLPTGPLPRLPRLRR